MPQPVARLTSPAQLVAALPHWLGFRATESLVVLCLHEPRGRLGLTLRFDLPQPAQEPQLVAEVVARVGHERATRVALVVLTEDPSPRARGRMVDELVDAVAPLPVTEGLLVRGGRFWSYLCSQERCCPAAGRSVEEGDGTDPVGLLAAETVLQGRPVLPSRADLEALLAAPSFLASSVGEQRLERAADELARSLAEQGVERVQARCLAQWRSVLDRWCTPPGDLDDEEAATLVLALEWVSIRDEVASWCLRRGGALQGLLQELCRRTPPPWDAPVCTLLAWVVYAAGGGATVGIALERALSSDPGYSLARLLAEAMGQQLPPEQIRQVMRGRRAA